MVQVTENDATRLSVGFMGSILGTASGWDETDHGLLFYDFKPAQGFEKLRDTQGNIFIDYESGKVNSINSDGEDVEGINSTDFIKMLWDDQQP